MENNKAVAETILEQLGGNQFLVMTGAKNLLFGDKSLIFQAARHSFQIQLEPSDTYAVKMASLRNGSVKRFAQLVYADQLRATFETFSGLRTSL